MALEAVAALAAKEISTVATNMEASRQLVEKISMQSPESIKLSQVNDLGDMHNDFRLGEINDSEIENKDFLKEKETEAKNEINNKIEGTEHGLEDLEPLTTEDERIAQTPSEGRDDGYWKGERGNGTYVSEKQDIKVMAPEGVQYKGGIPDFTPHSKATVEINMTSDRYGETGNFKQADAKGAEYFNKIKQDGRNDWTPRDIADWREKNDYLWHECNDRTTCQLIPRKINQEFSHLGGVAECKRYEALNHISEFDIFDK